MMTFVLTNHYVTICDNDDDWQSWKGDLQLKEKEAINDGGDTKMITIRGELGGDIFDVFLSRKNIFRK